MPLNVLPDEVIRGADRTHVWFNVLLSYCVAVTIPLDHTWWSSPLFVVARAFPHSSAVWSWSLIVAASIYTVGSFRGLGKPHRGAIVIAGSLACFLWYFALTLCLARQSYVDPLHSASLWPLMLVFIALLYGHRAVLYTNMFTGSRWATDPFQLYAITFLILVSIAQVVIGVSPNSVVAQFDKQTQVSLAGANLVGGIVAMIGLHLRRMETGLWVELWGYASLVMTLCFFIYLNAVTVPVPIATIGFTLAEAFVLASLHRALQITFYKWAVYRGNTDTAAKLRAVLTHAPPPPLVAVALVPPTLRRPPPLRRHHGRSDDGDSQ